MPAKSGLEAYKNPSKQVRMEPAEARVCDCGQRCLF